MLNPDFPGEIRESILTSLPTAKLGAAQPQLGPQEGQQGAGWVRGRRLNLGQGHI